MNATYPANWHTIQWLNPTIHVNICRNWIEQSLLKFVLWILPDGYHFANDKFPYWSHFFLFFFIRLTALCNSKRIFRWGDKGKNNISIRWINEEIFRQRESPHGEWHFSLVVNLWCLDLNGQNGMQNLFYTFFETSK